MERQNGTIRILAMLISYLQNCFANPITGEKIHTAVSAVSPTATGSLIGQYRVVEP
jgi:hypothetical protein